MRRSQSRRSSNTLPIRRASKQSNTSVSSLIPSGIKGSAIPRPSFGMNMTKTNYGRNQDQSLLATGTTPSKSSQSRMTMATPSKGSTTPQSMRGNIVGSVAKPYLKETRNLSDKNCTKEMMQSVANFLSDSGYPEFISIKEMQKIDKQSFIKYFNFLYQFIDRTYQLAPRFNEEDLMRNVKELGYCGTLAKSALVSIGALHSTSQIIGLLSWLTDLVRKLMFVSDEDTIEKMELRIMTDSYEAWCMEQPFELEEEFRALYKEKHQIEEGVIEEIQNQIANVVDEYRVLEKKSSHVEDLKADKKRLENLIEELNMKDVNLQQRFQEVQQEEKHSIQQLEETKGKTVAMEQEISQLVEAAKNCKLSAVEARRIKSDIADIRGHITSCSEQRSEVAKLVEKREIQLANISADVMTSSRGLNVELMDMGMTGNDDVDWKETLMEFFASKTKELSETEGQCLAINEKKERILVDTSRVNMELKHAELQKKRTEEELLSVKTEREEMERLYLSQLAQLENISAAPRSDPNYMRNQYELDGLRKKIDEQKLLMDKQENDLKRKMDEYALLLQRAESDIQEAYNDSVNYHCHLLDGYKQAVQAVEEGTLPLDQICALLPEPNF